MLLNECSHNVQALGATTYILLNEYTTVYKRLARLLKGIRFAWFMISIYGCEVRVGRETKGWQSWKFVLECCIKPHPILFFCKEYSPDLPTVTKNVHMYTLV